MNSIVTPLPSRSSSSSDEPLGRPYIYTPIYTVPRPAPKCAYGFILDTASRRRWTRWYCELIHGDKIPTMTPEEVEHLLDRFMFTTTRQIPGLIYNEFPRLPRLRNKLLPVVDGNPAPQHYLFVLRDDATWQGMAAPLDPELVAAVGRRLGVPGQEPGWYAIAGNAK